MSLADLCAAPGAYELLAAIDLLDRRLPAARPFGEADALRDERLRLHHGSALHHDLGEISAVELVGEPPTAHLTATLLGLCGASTPLPLYMAEEADQDDDHGAAIRGLLDVFHHRLLALLVRGVRAVDLPAALRPGGEDPWSRRLLALLGLADAAGALPPALRLRLAPVLASGVRSPATLAAALRIALAPHLGPAQLRVEPLSGGWTALDEAQWTRLGTASAHLGDPFVLGTEVQHPAGAADIVIGPLSGEHYKVFTPGAPGHALVRAVADGFTPEPIRYDLVLEIEDLRYPPGILGARSLGQDLWLARADHGGLRTRMVVPVD